ncbi:MAG: LamG domain-containing protein, partial [Sphingobacterium thalpophilum]
GKKRAYGLFLNDNTLSIYDWGGVANRSTGITLNDNTWHHIAMTFNSGVINGTLIYIDGVLKLTTTMTISNQGDPFIIGSSVDPYNQFFSGSIDDVRFWNVIRT